ncbi:Ada metal-binding domain-containing protein [Chitinophaga lutea]
MYRHSSIDDATLHRLIRRGKITLGGYRRTRIYGRLHCPAGKRMLRSNRVFFLDETEALQAGYRPCGRCMPDAYRRWKNQQEAGFPS